MNCNQLLCGKSLEMKLCSSRTHHRVNLAMLLAVRLVKTTSRAPWAWRSLDISSRFCFMSAHILSKLEAEMRWHLRSTCQVMGVYAEDTIIEWALKLMGRVTSSKF